MPGPYSYDNAIPEATNDPSVDQPVMKQNFASIQSYNQEDHIDFDQGTAGLHKRVRFPSTAYDPGVSSVYPMLFTKIVNGIPELFFYSGTQAQSSDQYTIGAADETDGSTFLFGGVILKWGKITTTGNPATVYSFPTAFPNYGYVVITTGPQLVNSVTKTGFKLQLSTIYTIYYIAIGS